jgi:hypothetical protein
LLATLDQEGTIKKLRGNFSFHKYLCKYCASSFIKLRYIDLIEKHRILLTSKQTYLAGRRDSPPLVFGTNATNHSIYYHSKPAEIQYSADYARGHSQLGHSSFVRGYRVTGIDLQEMFLNQISSQKRTDIPLPTLKETLLKNSFLTRISPFQKSKFVGFSCTCDTHGF